jgi:hypothetical protein
MYFLLSVHIFGNLPSNVHSNPRNKQQREVSNSSRNSAQVRISRNKIEGGKFWSFEYLWNEHRVAFTSVSHAYTTILLWDPPVIPTH